MMRRYKKLSQIIVLTLMVFVSLTSAPVSYALTSSQQSALNMGALYFNTENSCSASSSPVLTGDNPGQAFSFFKSKGLSPEQAAAMVGNFMQESTEKLDTHAGEGKSHQGIAQWDNGRWRQLVDWAESQNRDKWDLITQLEWSWEELSNGSYKPVLEELKQKTTVAEAVKTVLDKYEGAPGQEEAKRVGYAEDVLKKYQSASTGSLEGTSGVNGDRVNPQVRFKYGSGPRLQSGLPPGANISREDWAKLFLKSLAVGSGKPESEVITEEKVKAVVAWEMAEGGSTTTPGSYNALNVAKDSPQFQGDLNPVYNHVYADGNEHPAFKTVDEGVESNVRFVEKPHYSRLYDMLLDPEMTATKFVDNFDNKTYKGATGQLTWAAGGYLTLFKDTVNGLDGDKKQTRYDEPILGQRAKDALTAMGVIPSNTITKLDINAAGGVAVNCAGGDAVRVGNLVFPLRVTKTEIEGSLGGCLDKSAKRICIAGHPYKAFDLFSPESTEVRAATDGKVVSAKIGTCGHGFGSAFTAQVYNEAEGRTYFYQHMSDTSGKVTKGQTIKAGDVIGSVGGSEADCGTSPHLHFDAVTGNSRPACSRLSCSEDKKKLFIDIGAELYTSYTGLP